MKIQHSKPAKCEAEENSEENPFGGEEDPFDYPFRKKREASWEDEEKDSIAKYKIPENSEWEKQVKPKMEYVRT